MDFQEALARVGDKRKRCKTADWLATLDSEDVQDVKRGVAEMPIHTVWRVVVHMGYAGSKDTWSRHFRGQCVCSR